MNVSAFTIPLPRTASPGGAPLIAACMKPYTAIAADQRISAAVRPARRRKLEGEMRSDVDLLNALCGEAPIVVDRTTGLAVSLGRKQLAHWTGLAVQTVSDYSTGKYNIPVDFWRRVLDHYLDARIIGLLLGDSHNYELVHHGEVRPNTAPEFFRDAVEQVGAFVAQQEYIAEILIDGRIDELDGNSVQEYHDAYLRHRLLDAKLHRSIIDKYQRAVAAKAVAR